MSKNKTRTAHAAGADQIDFKKLQMELAEVRLIVDVELKRNDGVTFQKGVVAECLRGKLYKVITDAIAGESLSLSAFGIKVESADVHVDKRDQPY